MFEGPRLTKTLLSGRTFQGPRYHLPVTEGKGQTLVVVRSVGILHLFCR